MEVIKDINIIDKAIWLDKEKILIIADLHIGYEEALNKQGILVPRHQFKETKQQIIELFRKVRPKSIIINGDLKHEFGEISKQEWYETLNILDLLLKNSEKVILVKGNHDTILEPIANKNRIEIVEYFYIPKQKIIIIHGDKILTDYKLYEAKVIIIGHEHPSISLREGFKVEQYKCFLVGKWRDKELIVMPSFIPIIEGSDIRKEKILSPFIKDIEDFDVFIIGDKIYKFGKMKNIP